jgi:hypothetical protein
MSRTRLINISSILLLLFTAPSLFASPPGVCSLATLNGSYGFYGQTPAILVGDPSLQVVISGIIRFDGKGNLSGESIANVEGWGAGAPGAFAGTYTVGPDCTYSGEHTGEDGETLHFTGTITGSGMLQGMHFVVTDPGWVAAGTVKKIQPAPCSVATLRGPFALFGEGTITAYNPPAPLVHVGTATYDGAGNVFGSDTIMLNGAESADSYTATYTVTAECMISVDITSTAVGLVHQQGWIVGKGNGMEVHLIVTDPEFLFTEGTKKQ